MLTTPKSLCRGCLLLAVLLLLCLLPGSARANAPAPDPYWKTIILASIFLLPSLLKPRRPKAE